MSNLSLNLGAGPFCREFIEIKFSIHVLGSGTLITSNLGAGFAYSP
jgi:hypothetical protein